MNMLLLDKEDFISDSKVCLTGRRFTRLRDFIHIEPGKKIKAVDALITNFHLPQSTLLMLVSAFMGRETALDVYREAVEEKYRFFSFGDAMFIESGLHFAVHHCIIILFPCRKV